MKRLLFLLAAASIVLASCSSVDSKIVGRGVDNDGRWVVTTDISGVTTTTEVFDSLYKVQPSGAQKYQLAGHLHTLWILYTLLALGTALMAYGAWSGYNQKSAGGFGFVAFIMIGILVIAGGLGSVGWSASKEADIPKITYDSLMRTDGNLKAFWDVNLYK